MWERISLNRRRPPTCSPTFVSGVLPDHMEFVGYFQLVFFVVITMKATGGELVLRGTNLLDEITTLLEGTTLRRVVAKGVKSTSFPSNPCTRTKSMCEVMMRGGRRSTFRGEKQD
jgi:hypothetical protein